MHARAHTHAEHLREKLAVSRFTYLDYQVQVCVCVLLASYGTSQLSANRKERTTCSLAESDETKVSPYHSFSQIVFLGGTSKMIAQSRGNLAYENTHKES